MSQFSATRLADFQTALTNNTYLSPAMAWLQTNTPLSRVSNLELYEAIASATSAGGFVVTFNGHSIP